MRQGLKATELVVAAAKKQIFLKPIHIQNAIDLGIIEEIEYIVPNLPYRIKSFLLPAGTTIGRSSMVE